MIVQRNFTREARQINYEHDLLVKQRQSAGERAARIGETICRVKEGLPHGGFEKWVEEHLSFGLRQAQKYMAFHGRTRELDTPTRELLASEWQEFSHPGCPPKAHHGAPLGDINPEELEQQPDTEPAPEPEPRRWVPDPGEMNVGRHKEATIILICDAATPDVVRPYFLSEHGLAGPEKPSVMSAEEAQALGFACGDEEIVESLPEELPADASEGGILESYRRGVYAAAVPTILAGLGIDLGAIDWSGPGPLDSDFGDTLWQLAA